MVDVAVSVPHLAVIGALTLLHDFVERRERGGKVHDRDHASLRKRRLGNLTGRVATKHLRLAQNAAQLAQSLTNRSVELADRFVAIALS